MQQFKTLMLREWMQQRQTWIRMGIWIPIIFWAAMYAFLLKFGMPDFQDAQIKDTYLLTNLGLRYQTGFIAFLAFIGILLMIPGLPYRDLDDKSVAFWRSLPVTDSSAVIVPVLMNAIVLPLMAIMTAIALNLLLSAPLWAGDLSFKLGLDLLLVYIGASLQAAFTLLWFLPVVLLLAVGNSLVRRWGIAIVLIGTPTLENMLSRLFNGHLYANFLHVYFSGFNDIQDYVYFLSYFSEHVNLGLQFTSLLNYIVNWPFFFVLLSSAACLYALILRRKNGQTA